MKQILVIFLVCLQTALFAQGWKISGTVVECKSQKPIAYVNVGITGSKTGIYTDAQGAFTIDNVQEGEHILEFSALGYESKKTHIHIYAHKDNKPVIVHLCQQSYAIDQVVVTGTRTERQLMDAPIQTQLISSKTLENLQTTNFKDALETELTGVNFTNNGGNSNINMLGFSGKYVLFLVDGERMAGETFDNIDYNRIDLDNVERIEIVKGANSSLYGSNAIGGVINIITKKPDKPFETSLQLRRGSLNEQQYRAMLSTKQKSWYGNITAGLKTIDPYLLEDSEPQIQLYESGKSVALPLSSTYIAGFKDFSLHSQLGYQVSSPLKISAKGGVYFKERLPGGREGEKVTDHYYGYSGNIKSSYDIDSMQAVELSVSYDRYDKFDNFILLKTKEKNYENYQIRSTATYFKNWEQNHALTAGVDYLSDNLMTLMFTSDESQAYKQAQTIALFAQQEYELFPKLTLVGGARVDYHSQFGTHFTPRVAAMYKPHRKIVVRGGYSGGFRSPTLKELYTDWFHPDGGGFQIIGNSNMKAETSNNFNVSSEFYLGKTVLTALSQYSLIDNMVNFVWVNNDTVVYKNTGNAEIWSNELSMATRVGKYVSIKFGYSFVYDNLGSYSIVRPHSVTARADYSRAFIKSYTSTINISGKYHSKVDIYNVGNITDRTNGENMEDIYKVAYEGYPILKMGVSQKLPYNCSIHAGINNLLNYKPKFSSFYSSISPGRTFYAEVKWRF